MRYFVELLGIITMTKKVLIGGKKGIYSKIEIAENLGGLVWVGIETEF